MEYPTVESSTELLNLDNLPSALREAIVRQTITIGEVLYRQGDPARYIYALEMGRIKLVHYTADGKTVTFQVIEAGESLGEPALFSEVYHCDAIAEVRSRVIAYPKPLLLNALDDHPHLAHDMIKQLIVKMKGLKLRLELREIRSAHDRVLQYLRYMAQPDQTTINFDRPLKSVAADIGLTPEAFYRTLARLEKEGIITRIKRQITLHQAPAT
jgi:CRP-like cAMP-binding protein